MAFSNKRSEWSVQGVAFSNKRSKCPVSGT